MKYRDIREISMNLIPVAAFLLALLIGTIMVNLLAEYKQMDDQNIDH